MPLWTEIGDLMPAAPALHGGAAPVALGRTCVELADRAGRPRAGRPRRRAPRDRAGQPGPRRQAVRDADAVGRHPVPDAGRGRARAPAHPARVPVRRRGRGRVDGRRAATRCRCAAATSCRRPAGTGMPTTTPPAGRWRGSTAWTSRSSTTPRRSSSSSAATRSPTPSGSRPSARAPSGSGAIPGCARCRHRGATPGTPLLAYRWEDTDAALADQLRWRTRAIGGTVEPGHAAVRFTNPTTGGDVLPTIRAEMHRVARGAETAPRREVGSSVYQVFDGAGTVTVGDSDLDGRPAATCSSSRPGSRCPLRSEAGTHRLRLRRPGPVPLQRRARSSRRCSLDRVADRGRRR